MSFVDKSLSCSSCGRTFTFSADEQAFFAAKGFTNEPKRCPLCREARKAEQRSSDSYGSRREQSSSGSYGPRREMYPAVCAECGKQTQVPFEPRTGRPVYCSDCYNKVRTTQRR